MKKNILIGIIAIFMIQCKTTKNQSTMTTSYEYIDGNGNLYAISPTTIVYDPISPAESSTGTYSGGEEYTVTIEAQHFNSIKAAVDIAIKKTEDQTTERNKGNSTLVLLPSKTTYIFKMNSVSKKEIEDAIYLASHR